MTLDEFAKIAGWLEWRKVKPFGCTEIWVGPDRQPHGNVEKQLALTDSEGMEVLNALTARRYAWYLDALAAKYYGVCFSIWVGGDNPQDWIRSQGSTIPEAIGEALLQLAILEVNA